MPKINVTEEEFMVLADAANDAKDAGKREAAEALDKLARKANAALSKHNTPRLSGMTHNTRWQDMPSVLID